MPHYLVTARPKIERLPDLAARLAHDEFRSMQPFGRALTVSLRGARQRGDGSVTWEEEDYCHPPLAEERAAVLDEYFEDLKVQLVRRNTGWRRIKSLPHLFPALAETLKSD
jgi:hypothetical protein